MTQYSFLQDSRFHLLNGLPCCTYTLTLLKEALSEEGPQTFLFDRLNLVTFGLNQAFESSNAEKQAVCLGVLAEWAEEEVKESFRFNEDFRNMAMEGCRREVELEGRCSWENVLIQ